MAEKFQSIKGFYDILPEQSALWMHQEAVAARILAQYGYRQIRLPLVEPTSLFERGVGELTDIVEKEMYSWEDVLNGDRLTLRPEGTAGCIRAVVQHNLTYNAPQRLWYCGPMFRHENVQKGRQRQFHQIGCEAVGFAGPDVDAEQMVLLARLWRALGLQDQLTLQINTIGDAEERSAYRQALIEHFTRHAAVLDEDARRRLHANPLRLLDSKNPQMQETCNTAPHMTDVLGEASRSHFDALCQQLQAAGVAYVINPRLVRGLDYYNRTVFEWVTTRLGSQGTVAAGGRYDTLVAQLGGKPTPACGFAIGLERMFLLLQEQGVTVDDGPDIYLVFAGEAATGAAPRLAEQLRDAGLSVLVHAGGGKFAAQMKKADASGARYAVILGDDEVAQSMATCKPLRGQGEQRSLTVAALIAECGGGLQR